MSEYARRYEDERFGTGDFTDERNLLTRNAIDKRAELRQLVLSRATIRINVALFCDYCVLEHGSAVRD